jgi:L-iditol 2-dehydrogenase
MEKIPQNMRAAVYRGINDVRLETVPVPRISANELLVKVAACGVCPTDIKKIRHGTVPPPRIFGHETAGTIVRLGARVQKLKIGERVALHHHVPCLGCQACRHRAFAQCPQYKRTGITAGFEPAGGGFAEYVRVMPFVFPGIVKIPVRNSFVEAAMLEPVNTILKATKRLSLLRGDNVLVVGQGPVGLIFTKLLSMRGIRVIATDLFNSRLKLAQTAGATAAIKADDKNVCDRIQSLTGKCGLQAAIISAPSDVAAQQAQQVVNGGGQILLFAHTRRGSVAVVDLSTICIDEKDLIGSYSSDITLQEEVARLVFSRSLDVRSWVTHQFSLEKTADALALAGQPSQASLKIMVTPGQNRG